MTLIRLAALTLAASLPATFALAQTAPAPQNPLRPANTRSAPATPPAAATAPAAQAPSAEAPKPKRQRSEAQLANDNRMRACGQEWRQNKAQLTAQGKTWRVFNVECRARLKAQGR
ncbi:MAG: hypothetical protein MUF11_15800 [Beijerinckiaceae bacterium]|nr:hypothetical protein [Beijerinckiaceae bacterium]